MRHRKHTSKLNRTSEHRAALLRNLAVALITNDRIRTTKVKATQLRPFVEKLITLAKEGTLAAKRTVVSRLGDRDAAHQLYTEVVARVSDRNSGYLRIVQDGPRMGDGAPMAFIEFVDARPASAEENKPDSLEDKLKAKRHERRKAARKAATA